MSGNEHPSTLAGRRLVAPRPWTRWNWNVIYASNGVPVCTLALDTIPQAETAKANAELLLAAVNQYELLLDIEQAARQLLHGCPEHLHCYSALCEKDCQPLRDRLIGALQRVDETRAA